MFVPGPVDVAPEVLAAQARPMLNPSAPELDELKNRIAVKSKRLFQTENDVTVGSFSGSGAQEMAIRNFVHDTLLCCANGCHGERWAEIARANGKQVDLVEAEWGSPITPEALRTALSSRHYQAVTIVHNETSTGLENPLSELAAVVHEVSPETLILVDAVTSLGGVKIDMDALGLDFVFASSQHCLALPPGLALSVASHRALDAAQTVENRGWYFDILRQATSHPTALLFALDIQLDRIHLEGLENRYARHAALARSFENWAADFGMELFTSQPYRSKTVVVVKNSLAWNINDLNKFLLLRGMSIANGCGKLKNLTYCVSVMGETQMSDLENLQHTMELFMTR